MEKLKQRVASSSSRVIASLQQAATGTFQSQQQAGSGGNQDAGQRPLGNEPAPPPSLPLVRASAASLLAAGAAAHLTEREREILLEVFKKEEQFQRDTIEQMRALEPTPTENCPPNRAATAGMASPSPFASKQNRSGYGQSRHQSGPLAWSTSGGSTASSGASSPFVSARSATPLSASHPQQQQQQQRAPSSCSTATLASATGASQPQAADAPMGQCRICRKLILANETCHLCSACDQFVCEDCGSYSATDQHWMCSSCRRRATKPAPAAIAADALRGLNQSSSAARMMTLRSNQAELARAACKGGSAGESSASSSSSSGCSSAQSTATNGSRCPPPPPATSNSDNHQKTITAQPPYQSGSREPAPAKYEQQQQQQRRPEPELSATKTKTGYKGCTGIGQQDGRNQVACGGLGNFGYSGGGGAASNNNNNSDDGQGQQRRQQQQQPAGQMKRYDASMQTGAPSLHARGDPCGADGLRQGVEQPQQLREPLASRPEPCSARAAAGDNKLAMRRTLERAPSLKRRADRHHHQQLLARRASVANVVAAPELSRAAAAGSLSAGLAAATASMRKPQPSDTFFAATSVRFHAASGGQDHPYGSAELDSRPLTFGNQQQQPQFATQPQTMVTASSDLSLGGPRAADGQQHAAESAAAAAQQQQYPAAMLIPIPPELMHLRRLSDQSNLVRRSSIISETIEGGIVPFARNRSHSNIDALGSLTYMNAAQSQGGGGFMVSQLQQQQQQQQQLYATASNQRPALIHGGTQQRLQLRGNSTDDNCAAGQHNKLSIAGYASQQRRPSDQWVLQQHVAAQQEALGYAAKEYKQHQQDASQIFASIITPYAQKRQRRMSEDGARSDSSSDIGEDLRDAQAAFECHDNEQPSEYFAPPRAAHYFEQYQQQQQQNFACAGQPISIPSVSVSEFNSSQQRLNQLNLQQQQQQNPYGHRDYIMTTPMQINLAIEQAIQQQQRRPSNEFLAASGHPGYLMPRRGSSGRVLPKIPGEQSRSLLDLPLDDDTGNRKGADKTTLDLPLLSPTLRRASAPDGQDIKIVVNDLDMNGKQVGRGGGGGKSTMGGGDFYERLVLYRDDSLDPSTGMAHGFGLQVMGGKVDSEDNNKLHAFVSYILPGGPSDKAGLRVGDRILEWDGKCLVDMSYEQVADVIESSANIAELLVRPVQRVGNQLPAAHSQNLARSQRRMSQQTDLKRAAPESVANYYRGHRLSCTPTIASQESTCAAVAWKQQQSCATGRRLPQIPGASLPGQEIGGSLYVAGHQSMLDGGAPNLLGLGPNYQQQSLSASELGHHPTQHGQYAERVCPPLLNPCHQNSQHPVAQSTINVGYLSSEVCGSIGLQVSVDERVSQLEVSVLSAINMDTDPSLEYFVRVKVLPESKHIKACATQPSCDMNWKETFVFQNFPIQQIQRMALEIGIWVYDEAPRLSAHQAQPICEALVPIHSAQERNTDFWPLRPPVSSPQSRRKSLNDLMENLYRNERQSVAVGSDGAPPINLRASCQTIRPAMDSIELAARGRSLSNKNLPETGRFRAQPRRASDEIATGSSYHRFIGARASPADCKLSISVINMADGGRQSAGTSGARPASRSGAGGLLPAQPTSNNISVELSKVSSQSSEPLPATSAACGRRYSLVGVQSMSGYRSQKNSQGSGSTDQDSPRRPIGARPFTGSPTIQQSALVRSGMDADKQPYRATGAAGGGTGTGSGSRRGSTEQGGYQCQRKGSFAMQTLRKLKRTMSLTKGGGGESDPDHSNQDDSHLSSSASADDPRNNSAEDVGIPKKLSAHKDYVGKLKLGFILTKGQLEIDVICAQGLQFEQESCIGVYVKVYLYGKTRSNKRKTRIVQPSESPIFRQLIKYDGSLVDNKALHISVWQKQSGLKGKVPLGFTVVQLGELNLERIQISWYNLRRMEIACSSSIDEW